MSRLGRPSTAIPLRVLLIAAVFAGSALSAPVPAATVAIYSGDVTLSVSAPDALPPGTGITLSQGVVTLGPVMQIGDAVASRSGSAVVPGVIQVFVSGSASAPPTSLAMSMASATTTGAILNDNNFSVAFPITIGWSATVVASAGANEFAAAGFSYSVLLDGSVKVKLNEDVAIAPPFETITDGGTVPLTLNLTPGLHSLLLTDAVDGFASASATSPVPEPATLTLLGTVMVGVGLAARRRRLADSAQKRQRQTP